jgi:DNA-binding response OmpR family regulator
MPSQKSTVLVVDDEKRLLLMMQDMLTLEGYRVIKATDGENALDVLARENPDLILLDVMMPGMDGYAVCRRIREFSQVPIIMVTAKDNNEEIIEGLECGADDYVPKPFSREELSARVKAVLRRTGFKEEPQNVEPYSYNGLTVDHSSHRVILNGIDVDLSATEYRLLSYMAINAGRILTPNQILSAVWGTEYANDQVILRMAIRRLRQRLKENGRDPKYVLTKQGIGYMLQK